jgi:hypothetical protein
MACVSPDHNATMQHLKGRKVNAAKPAFYGEAPVKTLAWPGLAAYGGAP